MTASLFDDAAEPFACKPAPVAEAPLPVFNPLSCDGGRCQMCETRRQEWYLASYDRNGNSLPNRFVCGGCLAAAEVEAKAVGGRVERFGVAAV